MPNATLVGDDLTGTLDSGYGFAARGRGVRVYLANPRQIASFDSPPVNDVLAVDTNSRDTDPDVAARAVRTVIEASDAALVYKKIDSTLRGNVVREVEAALDASNCAIAVIAPAFPATGRVTRDGVHYVDDEPLARANYGVDKSTLSAYFGTSRYPVEPLYRRTISHGVSAVRKKLEEVAEETLITCDATKKDHLRYITEAAASLDSEVLYVGSGGLAKHVSLPGSPALPSAPGYTDTEVLAVVGSVNDRTLEQLEVVPRSDIVQLDPRRAISKPESFQSEIIVELRNRLESNGRAVLTAATDSSDIVQTGGIASQTKSEVLDPGQRITQSLAITASKAIEVSSPGGLFLTGGEVARATLDAIGASKVCLTGASIAEGIPVGWIVDGVAADTYVVTKAGGFGSERTIVNCIAGLQSDRDG